MPLLLILLPRPSTRYYAEMVYAAHAAGQRLQRDDWEGWANWERHYNGPTYGVARVC